MKKDKKVSIVELFKSNGLLFPSSAEEVLAFEKINDINKENPKDWDNPFNIIKHGKIEKINKNNVNISEDSVLNLSMAARDGKIITDDVRRKMNNDREQSKKD